MRAAVIVIDSFGIGAMPDAEKYGDEGANTALHICQQYPEPKWPNLKRLGLGNAAGLLGDILPGCSPVTENFASFGVMKEKSPGKDTTTGHWEIAGIELNESFTTFPPEYPSFPPELTAGFEKATGTKMLGNKAASGTVIIEELGPEQEKTGFPIVYTSADSCFQIAAHEDIIPLNRLYDICEKARKLCDPYNVGRVIARPFIGKAGSYTRTESRRDFSISLPGPSILDHLQKHGIKTTGVGKIGDIFNEQGLTDSHHDKGNEACLIKSGGILKSAGPDEFVFVNLVDTDMLYGHRREVRGYYDAVSEVDQYLGSFTDDMRDGDMMIITADHGCDPTFKGTDHTREYVPLLVFRKGFPGRDLGIRGAFSDIAATLAEYFNVPSYPRGKSFYNDISE